MLVLRGHRSLEWGHDAMTRAVLIDDHRMVALGLVTILRARGVDVVAVEHGLDAGLQAVTTHRPDVIVCDVVFGQEPTGLGFPTALAATAAAGTPLLLLSAFSATYFVTQAKANGAAGYLTKDADITELVSAIEHVAEGGTAFPTDGPGVRAPSDHDLVILRMVADGLSNGEIGNRLVCSPRTVETHLERLFERYGVHDRIALTKVAERKGWILALPDQSA